MSKKEIEKLLENVKSKSDIAKRFGYNYYNGNIGKEIEFKLKKVGLTFESVLPKKEIKRCQCCGNSLKRGQKKFCSTSCSAKVTNVGKVKSEESKIKISNKLKIYFEENEIDRSQYIYNRKVRDKVCTNCGNIFTTHNYREFARKTCSEECATKKKLDRSYQNGSRKTIKYLNKWYGEVVLESTWEEKVAMELDANNIKWKRPEPLKWVDSNGESHLYYSDFYLEDYDVYLDPKNPYCMKLDKEKMSIVTKDVNVIYGDLEIVINYIKEL